MEIRLNRHRQIKTSLNQVINLLQHDSRMKLNWPTFSDLLPISKNSSKVSNRI